MSMDIEEILRHIQEAFELRKGWFDNASFSAFRLFNGFVEGFPDLTIDLYARTIVLYNFAHSPETIQGLILSVIDFLNQMLPWTQSIVVKTRLAKDAAARHGIIARGGKPDNRVLEYGVWYAVNLQMTSDASLYLDTRQLRRWITQHTAGLRVLNTFAYTGSLGVAATAGGARQVIHLDRNRKFLNLAKTSYSYNGFPVQESDFVSQDFFPWTSRMRRTKQLFDMVFLDPPFFSLTTEGRVDLGKDYFQLINKVRPLVDAGGTLVAVNNALFVSGQNFILQLERLCQDGYMTIDELIPVPEDFTGFSEKCSDNFPTDPTPFNHPTKIAILRILKTK